jgi:hypothetical protein
VCKKGKRYNFFFRHLGSSHKSAMTSQNSIKTPDSHKRQDLGKNFQYLVHPAFVATSGAVPST